MEYIVDITLSNGETAVMDAADYASIDFNKISYMTSKTKDFYATIKQPDANNWALLHRVIMGNPDKHIDHKNGDTLDNRKSNLRFVTHADNMKSRKTHKNNKSGYKGVYYHNGIGRYVAQIRCDGKKYHLGTFKDPLDASNAYQKKAKELFGEFYRE